MPAWEATTILGAIAAVTTRVRVGALVLCNLFRHPATTAQATTTLDHLSGGRAILGLGSGWTRAEFEMMGVPFPDIKPRLRMLDEAVRVIKALWTEERITFDGEFYHLRDAIIVPKPVQKPHPPIMLGGSGKGLLRIAAREADIVNVISDAGRAGTIEPSEVAKLTDDAFRRKLDFVRSETRPRVAIPTRSRSRRRSSSAMLTDSRRRRTTSRAASAGSFGLDGEQVLRMPLALIGTPDECVAELRGASASGASRTTSSRGLRGPGLRRAVRARRDVEDGPLGSSAHSRPEAPPERWQSDADRDHVDA